MDNAMKFLGYGVVVVCAIAAVYVICWAAMDLVSGLYWKQKAKSLPYVLDSYEVALFISPVNSMKYLVVFKCDDWEDYDFIIETSSWGRIGAKIMSHFETYLKNRKKMFD